MAATISNVTFDCADPRSLSHFWSDVLGYPHSAFTPEMREDLLASGLTEDDLAARGVAESADGSGQRLFFHRVPEGKVVKNRVHLDLSVARGRRPTHAEVDAEAQRIVALGATLLRRYNTKWGPIEEYYYTLADPEGNEFCVQ